MTRRQALTFVEIDMPRCARTYGEAPCNAALGVTGAIKCHNTPRTCQDRVNFLDDPLTVRFAENTTYLPADIDCIPALESVEISPGIVSLGRSLGHRETLRATFRDLPHSDSGGFDKYLAERGYDAFARGTFFGRWRARSPYLRSRAMRVRFGEVGQTLAQMECRHYAAESFDGPGPDGRFTLVAKDPLKLLDDDRAQAPKLSGGFLLVGIGAGAASLELSPEGIGDEDYPESGHVNIGGKEICAFTRSGDVLTLTRAQYNTTAQAHNADDRVQLCLRYVSVPADQIIADLAQTYAGVPSAYIDAAAWATEIESYVGVVYTALIAEPVGVRTLINEMIEQVALSLWWDPLGQAIRLRVVRPVPIEADLFDEARYERDTLSVQEQPDLRLSQVWVYFGQINPLKKVDDLDNYRSTVAVVDLQGEADYGSPAIKRILSRWIPEGGRAVAQVMGAKHLARYLDPPRRFGFRVVRSGSDLPELGVGYQLGGWMFQDATGAPAQIPFQVTALHAMKEAVEVEAEEMLFADVPGALPGGHDIIIDSNTYNRNVRTMHDAIYGAPEDGDVVRFIVQPGVTVGSVSTDLPALHVGSWPDGVTVEIVNNGRIQGRGGLGGPGGRYKPGTSESVPSQPGHEGGAALYTREAITLSGSGELFGGGGGGGGGGQSPAAYTGGGGGGGAGLQFGAGGPGGQSYSVPGGSIQSGAGGQDGTADAGGDGGLGGNASSSGSAPDYAGGDGGGPGLDGAHGLPLTGGSVLEGSAGGDAGRAIDGVSYVTNSGTLDIRGPMVN